MPMRPASGRHEQEMHSAHYLDKRRPRFIPQGSLSISTTGSSVTHLGIRPMTKSNASRFLTLQELCSVLGVSKASFYKYQRQGVFPEPLRTAGGRLIFDRELVERCQRVVRTRTGINGDLPP